MAKTIDREILLGFVDEARGYLPRILEGIDQLRGSTIDGAALAEIHRLSHSIKGAAAMLGLPGLANIAFQLEEALEQVAAGQLSQDADTVEVLTDTAAMIGRYLDQLISGHLQERRLIAQVVIAFRRLRGLPEAGDAAEIDRLSPDPADAPTLDAATARTEPTAPAAPPTAAPPRPAPTPRDAFADSDDGPSADLLAAFEEEARDHLANAGQGLRALDKDPTDSDALRRVRQTIHTLKGAAAMVGQRQAADLAHRMEDVLDLLHSAEESPTADHLDLLFATTDALEDLLLNDDPGGEAGDLEVLYTRYEGLLHGAVDAADAADAVAEPLGEVPLLDLQPEAQDAGDLASRTAANEVQGPTVRVPIAHLDDVVRLVSELVVSHSTFERYFQQLSRETGELKLSTGHLKQLAQRFESETEAFALSRPQESLLAAGGGSTWRGAHDFDELELDRYTEVHRISRQLGESSSDLTTLENGLRQRLGDFESYLTRVSRLNGEIQDKLMRLRMVPIAQLSGRLYRTVRNAAQASGKQVDLLIEGEETGLDKTVLEDIQDPLLHLLRNAVGHGIEPPSLRQVMGKNERGRIRLHAFHEGTQVVLEVSDDGGGLDLERLRVRAVEGGWLSESDAAEAPAEHLHQLIFEPGFSTAAEVDEISGRGVGLDVVQSTVQRLEGTLGVRSSNDGTTFTIRLPLTLAVMRALLVRSGEQTYALPLTPVRQILRLDEGDIEVLGKESVVRVRDQAYPAVRLRDALGHGTTHESDAGRIPALILDLGNRRIALLVDRIVEVRDIVVKNLGTLLRQVPKVTGATLMGDGSVVLILDPRDLESAEPDAGPVFQTPQAGVTARRGAARIMVVDDSVSVRRVLSNTLRLQGWQPITARDGLDALETLQRTSELPDAILLDIEMPRMDGYELAATLQGRATYRHIPIVMLTSRSGDKHRRRAFEVGASEYLVKPYQDDVLISLLRRLMDSGNRDGSDRS